MSNKEEPNSQICFRIKRITWGPYDLVSPILLQEENGPCPLISLTNTLILQNEIENKNVILNNLKLSNSQNNKLQKVNELRDSLLKLHDSPGSIQLNELLMKVGYLLLVFEEDKKSKFDIDKLLESLPQLHTGLSVNPDILHGHFPKDDVSSQLFEVFDLKLRHGWIFSNYQDSESARDLGLTEDKYAKLVTLMRKLKTFDKIQDYLLPSEEYRQDSLETREIEDNRCLINKWLSINSSQLTAAGLNKLSSEVNDDEVVVFFRNNHFNSLYKKANDEFFLLITDDSFRKTSIVWQSLTSVRGDSDMFFDGEFVPVINGSTKNTSQGKENEDVDIVRILQEEEDNRLAKTLQRKYDSHSKNQHSLNASGMVTNVPNEGNAKNDDENEIRNGKKVGILRKFGKIDKKRFW